MPLKIPPLIFLFKNCNYDKRNLVTRIYILIELHKKALILTLLLIRSQFELLFEKDMNKFG